DPPPSQGGDLPQQVAIACQTPAYSACGAASSTAPLAAHRERPAHEAPHHTDRIFGTHTISGRAQTANRGFETTQPVPQSSIGRVAVFTVGDVMIRFVLCSSPLALEVLTQ